MAPLNTGASGSSVQLAVPFQLSRPRQAFGHLGVAQDSYGDAAMSSLLMHD